MNRLAASLSPLDRLWTGRVFGDYAFGTTMFRDIVDSTTNCLMAAD